MLSPLRRVQGEDRAYGRIGDGGDVGVPRVEPGGGDDCGQPRGLLAVPQLTEPVPVRDAIAEYIAKLVADAPLLPVEARAHLAALLTDAEAVIDSRTCGR